MSDTDEFGTPYYDSFKKLDRPAIPRVVHCKREPFDVYIGRPSKWGNPFILGVHGNRGQVISMYQQFIWDEEQTLLREQAIGELKGKILGCWCAPKACHGDILAAIANADHEECEAPPHPIQRSEEA